MAAGRGGDQVQLHLIDEDTLEVRLHSSDGACFDFRAVRQQIPAPCHAKFVVKDGGDGWSYEGCREHLQRAGWYIPRDEPYVKHAAVSQDSDIAKDPEANNQLYVGSFVNLTATVVKASKVLDDHFTGLSVHRVDVVEIMKTFSIGVVVGDGKSSFARVHYGAPPTVAWSSEAVIAHFASLELAKELCQAANLDLETCMQPYSTLSGGEKARAEVARVLALALELPREQAIVFENFSSLVDRGTAMKMASGLQKFVLRHGLRNVVLVSAYTDFVNTALRPDWLFECHRHRLLTFDVSGVKQEPADSTPEQSNEVLTLARSYCLAEAPVASLPQLRIRRALPCEWKNFREHHYKDPSLHPCAVCFVGVLGDTACAFSACVMEPVNFVQEGAQKFSNDYPDYPSSWLQQRNRRLFREHRTVVLPHCQGIGVAQSMIDCIAAYIIGCGADFTSQTVHPTYGLYRVSSKRWRALRTNQTEQSALHGNLKFSHWFRGEA
ncbi:unnamed protein product [Symbiodinium sp. KB8]|nr:unnamed protein product [Symbiodinium sp. KB8]